MNATQKYLDQVAAKHHGASDYRIAQLMEESRQRISSYRTGATNFDNKAALKVAELLGIDPLQIIAEVEKDRAKSDSDRDFWGGQLRRMGVAAGLGLCIVHTALFSGNADAATVYARSVASTEIYIMRLSRRLGRWLRRLWAELDGPFGLLEMSPA